MDDSPEKRIFGKKELTHKSKAKSIGQLKGISNAVDSRPNNRYESSASKKHNSSLLENKVNENRNLGGGILYSIKGQNKYKGGSIITKPKREPYLNNKYKQVEMGVIGEPIIGSTSRINALKQNQMRKDAKVTSLETRLPRIDISNHDISQSTNPTTSKNLKLPKLAKSNSRLIGIYGKSGNSKLKQNGKYKYGSNNKYRLFSNDKSVSESYLSKDDKNTKSISKLKIYKNNLKDNQGKELK